MAPRAWGLAFSAIAAVMALGLAAFVALRPRDLAGDRRAEPAATTIAPTDRATQAPGPAASADAAPAIAPSDRKSVPAPSPAARR
jgi:hypothetical protein